MTKPISWKYINKMVNYERSIYYIGKRNNFTFKIMFYNSSKGWLIYINHSKLDIRYNSGWYDIYFKTLDSAKEFCENFKAEGHRCLGKDAPKMSTEIDGIIQQ